MITFRKAKSISGTVQLPPNPDCLLLCLAVALGLKRTMTIAPYFSTPLQQWYCDLFKEHLSIRRNEESWDVALPDPAPPQLLALPLHRLPYADFILGCLLAAGREILGTGGIHERRIEIWKDKFKRCSCGLEAQRGESGIVLRLAHPLDVSLPQRLSDPDDLLMFLGIAAGKGKRCTVDINHHFQNPLRPLFTHMGYPLRIKSAHEQKPNDPFSRRIRMYQQKMKRKDDDEAGFIMHADFSAPVYDSPACILPGDDILGSLLLTAKAIIPRGQLVLDNMPLDSWAQPTLQVLRKMGCSPALQERLQTAFGSCGMITLQKPSLAGRKMECTPLYVFYRHLPMLVVCATFAQGQSVLRRLSDLHNDDPDHLEQLLSCVHMLGGRYGEMPDGMVIDGTKDFDGFDMAQEFSAGLNGACAVAGLRCNGTSQIADDCILKRWPFFQSMVTSLCEFY